MPSSRNTYHPVISIALFSLCPAIISASDPAATNETCNKHGGLSKVVIDDVTYDFSDIAAETWTTILGPDLRTKQCSGAGMSFEYDFNMFSPSPDNPSPAPDNPSPTPDCRNGPDGPDGPDGLHFSVLVFSVLVVTISTVFFVLGFRTTSSEKTPSGLEKMGMFFSKKKEKAPGRKQLGRANQDDEEMSEKDKAKFDMRVAKKQILKYSKKLEGEVKVYREKARALMKAKKKDRALMCLRMSKFKQKKLADLDNQVFMLSWLEICFQAGGDDHEHIRFHHYMT